MNIQIDDKYLITSDRLNVILNERKVHKTGKDAGVEYCEEISYHPNLASALNKYINLVIAESDCETVKELMAKLDDIKDVISSIA